MSEQKASVNKVREELQLILLDLYHNARKRKEEKEKEKGKGKENKVKRKRKAEKKRKTAQDPGAYFINNPATIGKFMTCLCPTLSVFNPKTLFALNTAMFS